MTRNLITPAQNTWCPGCGNFSIQHTLKDILAVREKEGSSLDNVVLVSGIGCHAKIADYLNINTVYTLHGRTIPVATGLKLANPDLTVICCAGDGDAYAEGLDHLIFAAKRNIDITMIVHNNRVYGLTTGQYTPTSPLGFKGKSTPAGTAEYPFNPLELMLASGATYIARGYTKKIPQLAQLIRQGIAHHGFAFIDILQICASFFNMTEYYQSRVYDLSGHDTGDFGMACAKAREWDYNRDAPIALGVFYEKSFPTFDERLFVQNLTPDERAHRIRDLFEAAK
ncbi:thiamine pyrophosphate-dependent enzyme [Methanoregula sp.]|uniref:thiamine pyrophosphate-dependent enzyme n=1 Tax=Methanoregula sp. TaxID=2052170 RepID=UPI002CE45584|nr:thiamine pyrophosphate-dependent enzyme [Methanoregula sp.]HVP97097.1 thiamine pyrophosphate-dependent enzyme [Methanoregula sp.]